MRPTAIPEAPAVPEKPAAPIAAPAPTSAAPAAAPAPSESDRIRDLIHRYEKAQSTLDAQLYARIYPSVDRERIERAFQSLASQSVEFEVRKIGSIRPGLGRGSTASRSAPPFRAPARSSGSAPTGSSSSRRGPTAG